MKLKTLFVVVGMALTLSACGPNVIKPGEEGSAVEDRNTLNNQQQPQGGAAQQGAGAGQVPGGPGASAQGADRASQFKGDPLKDPDSPLANRIFYFGYDSSRVGDADRAALDAHAAHLATNPTLAVRVEGHADERGSREYNIGLSERRAQAVRRFLLFQGAASTQIEVVSYGEERPQELGHDEAAWSRNRRVELVYP